jgi:hypothetical protein
LEVGGYWLNLLLALPSPWIQASLLLTGGLIFMVTEWRLALLALLVQYLVTGLLLASTGLSAAAGTQILTGAVACGILYLTARSGSGASLAVQRSFADWLLRFVTTTLTAVGVFGLGQPYRWLTAPMTSLTAALWLAAIGLLVVGLSRQPLRIGLGLLTFQAGFALLYAHLDTGLVVIGLLGSINLVLALTMSFLTLEVGRGGRP